MFQQLVLYQQAILTVSFVFTHPLNYKQSRREIVKHYMGSEEDNKNAMDSYHFLDDYGLNSKTGYYQSSKYSLDDHQEKGQLGLVVNGYGNEDEEDTDDNDDLSLSIRRVKTRLIGKLNKNRNQKNRKGKDRISGQKKGRKGGKGKSGIVGSLFAPLLSNIVGTVLNVADPVGTGNKDSIDDYEGDFEDSSEVNGIESNPQGENTGRNGSEGAFSVRNDESPLIKARDYNIGENEDVNPWSTENNDVSNDEQKESVYFPPIKVAPAGKDESGSDEQKINSGTTKKGHRGEIKGGYYNEQKINSGTTRKGHRGEIKGGYYNEQKINTGTNKKGNPGEIKGGYYNEQKINSGTTKKGHRGEIKGGYYNEQKKNTGTTKKGHRGKIKGGYYNEQKITSGITKKGHRWEIKGGYYNEQKINSDTTKKGNRGDIKGAYYNDRKDAVSRWQLE